jgi:hypothetical protein
MQQAAIKVLIRVAKAVFVLAGSLIVMTLRMNEGRKPK